MSTEHVSEVDITSLSNIKEDTLPMADLAASTSTDSLIKIPDDTQPVSQVFPETPCTATYSTEEMPSRNLCDTQPVSQIFPESTSGTSVSRIEVSSKNLDDTQPVSQVFPETSCSEPAVKQDFSPANILNAEDSDTDFSDDGREPTASNFKLCEPSSGCDEVAISGTKNDHSSVDSSGKSLKDAALISSSSTGSSITVNLSSMEKMSCDGDDANVIACSQDIFSSQSSSSGSQNTCTSSELIPTFQLSGEVTAYSSNVTADRLCPSTSSYELGGEVKTSTPVQSGTPASTNKCEEIISISDDECNNSVDRVKVSPPRDKRKLSSDSSDDCQTIMSVPKKLCKALSDSRQSIMVVAEVCKHSKTFKSASGSDSVSQTDSQAFHLHFSSSQSDQDTPESSGISGGSSTSQNSLWKSHWNSNPSSSNEVKESSLCDNISKDKDISNSNLNISLQAISDTEGDVQLLSHEDSKLHEEITLDNSGHQVRTPNNGVEILFPLKESNAWRSSNSGKIGQSRGTRTYTSSTPSSSQRCFVLNQALKTNYPVTMNGVSSNPSLIAVEGAEDEKNTQSSQQEKITEYSKEFSLTFSKTYNITCKVSVNMQEKRVISSHVEKLEDGKVCTFNTVDDFERELRSKDIAGESSSIPSQGSPGSVMSGPGPFILPQRQSIMSTTSSSSAGSSASNLNYKYHSLSKSLNSSQGDETCGASEEKNPLFKGLINLDVNNPSVSGCHVLDQWASTGSRHMQSWIDNILKGVNNHDVNPSNIEEKDDGEEIFGVVSGNKKLPAQKGRQKAASASGRPGRKKLKEVDRILVNEKPCDPPSANEHKVSNITRGSTPSRGAPITEEKRSLDLKGKSTEDDGQEACGAVVTGMKELPANKDYQNSSVSGKGTASSKNNAPRSGRKKLLLAIKTSTDDKPTDCPSASKNQSFNLLDGSTPSNAAPIARERSTSDLKHKSIETENIKSTPVREPSLFFLTPGAPVFARYDKYFYPAKVKSLARPNYWNVVFHDNLEKEVNEKFIVSIPTLEINQAVRVRSQSSNYAHGVVVSVKPSSGEDDQYTVELSDGKTVTVPMADLCLTMDQAKTFSIGYHQSLSSSSVTSPRKRTPGGRRRDALDLGQLVEGKRRTPKQSGRGSPCTPGPSSATKRQLHTDSTSDSEDSPLATVLVTGVQPEQEGLACVDPLARKGRGTKSKQARQLKDNEALIKQFGPLPPEGSKIFGGKYFLLTYTEAQPLHRFRKSLDTSMQSSDFETDADGKVTKRKSNSEAEEPLIRHNTDSECFEFSSYPFSKDRLRRQIECGSGTVLRTVSEVSSKDLKNTYVISNRPCYTAIFLQCMVRGIKGLSHNCIIECCKENKRLLDCIHNNSLPVGHSLLRRNFVAWAEHKSESPFKGQNILVASTNNSFVEFWVDILKIAGAMVFTKEEDIQQVAVVVSDNPCPDLILRIAVELKKPVVSSEWVKQSLILNKIQPFNAHRSFCHDFSDID